MNLHTTSCSTVHDTIGTLLDGIKLPFRRSPLKVIATYDSATFRKLLDIGDINILPHVVAKAMIADGRLSHKWNLQNGN